MKGFNLAVEPGGKFINWALMGEYYNAWHERQVCSMEGLGRDPDYTLPENRPRNRRFLTRRYTGVLYQLDTYSTPGFSRYVTGDIFEGVPGKIAECIDPTGIAKHLSPAACRLFPQKTLYLRNNTTVQTDPYWDCQPYFQVPAIIYADVDFTDSETYGIIRDYQATLDILSGTDARCQSYKITFHDKKHLYLDQQALDNWPFSNNVSIRLHTLTPDGDPKTVDLDNVELVSWGVLKPNDTQIYVESIDVYQSGWSAPYNPKVTPGYYPFVSHGHKMYGSLMKPTLVFNSNLAVCNYYNEDSWEPRTFYVRITVNGISYPDSSWLSDKWFSVYYQLDQKNNHTRLHPFYWTDPVWGWRTASNVHGGYFFNARFINVYRDITTYCIWQQYSLIQYKNTPYAQVSRGMKTKQSCYLYGTPLQKLQQFDSKELPWTDGNTTGYQNIGAWADTYYNNGCGYASFVCRGGCQRWENGQWIYYDGQYNGDAPVIGVGFWGYTHYYTGIQKPIAPLETDLFYGFNPIETLTAAQIASYGTYLDTMSYDKHIANSGDPVGMYYQQPVQWWTFPGGLIAGGILPFFRFAPNHPCLAENYVAGQTTYQLYFDLSTNWTGFLKRDFAYLADRTDDWL